jgi:predicted exporter
MVNNYSGVSQFLVSKEEQQHRIDRWNEFISKNKLILTDELCDKGKKYGFSPQAFSQFISYIQNSSELIPRNIEDFSELSSFVFQQNLTITESDGQCHIVNVLNVDNDKVEYVKGTFNSSFDVIGMNSTLSENLSDNFNYIGLACSIIVFLFLWFSFGRIELAIIAFLPMAISWIWILGLMTLFGIKFNIVNIILATFIFGQGDDYTIFMTEGCQSEYANRRKVLSSYKRSILQSAIIMFIGIGTLIISQHPAMRSLAEVTIIGMMCVVLMAYMIPPMLFKWLTYKNGKCRKHPITIKTILLGYPKDPMEQVQGRYIYKGALIMRTVKENLKDCNNAILVGDYYELDDKGYGEQAIMMALKNPKIKVIAHIDDDERRQIAKVAAEDFVNNVEFVK